MEKDLVPEFSINTWQGSPGSDPTIYFEMDISGLYDPRDYHDAPFSVSSNLTIEQVLQLIVKLEKVAYKYMELKKENEQ